MTAGLVYIDGNFVEPDRATVPILDGGFGLGLTVFDNFSLHKGKIFRLDAHLDRFYGSLKTVRFDSFPHSRADLSVIIVDTIRKSRLSDAVVGIMATRGVRQPVPLAQWTPTLIVQCTPSPPSMGDPLEDVGITACISTYCSIPAQSIPAQVKNSNRIVNYLAQLEAIDRGVQEPVLRTTDGFVTEGPNFNIFAVRNGRLYTPRDNLLRGITRDTVIEIAGGLGIEVIEGPLTPYDLYTADEVFITSTSRGAKGVVEIDGRTIAAGEPGRVTRKLNETYWSWRVGSPYATPVNAIAIGDVA